MVDAEVPVAGALVEATLTFEERTLDIELDISVQPSRDVGGADGTWLPICIFGQWYTPLSLHTGQTWASLL